MTETNETQSLPPYPDVVDPPPAAIDLSAKVGPETDPDPSSGATPEADAGGEVAGQVHTPVDPVTWARRPAGDSLSVGRIVHYVLAKHHRSAGAHRPAICVAVNSPTNGNFQVFTDGRNDGEPNVLHEPSVSQGMEQDDGSYPEFTWHWPERA
jgi:hypothetical protein